MKNISTESILYAIEGKITEAKKDKIRLLSIDKNHPNIPNVDARINSLVLIKSELIRENKNNKEYNMTKDDEAILLTKMVEKREDNVKKYSDNGRPELAEADYQELLIIKEFLPKMPTEEAIKEFISETIDNYIASKEDGYKLSMKDMGQIKPIVNKIYPTINGGLIKEILVSKI